MTTILVWPILICHLCYHKWEEKGRGFEVRWPVFKFWLPFTSYLTYSCYTPQDLWNAFFFFFYKRGAAVVRISEIIHAVCAMSVNNNIFSSFRPQILLPVQPISQSYVDLPKIPLCLHHSTTPPPLLANLQLFPTANRSKSKFLNLHLSPSIKQPQNSFHPYFL